MAGACFPPRSGGASISKDVDEALGSGVTAWDSAVAYDSNSELDGEPTLESVGDPGSVPWEAVVLDSPEPEPKSGEVPDPDS